MTRVKINQQPGYIVHRRSYRESSLLVDVFTRNHGRLTLIAKGCRRNKSQSQGLFLPFIPIYLSWTGRGELPILTGIEQIQFMPQMNSAGVKCGYYINELLLKLLHRHDAHERLFDKYSESIYLLLEKNDPFTVLRVFEKYLLQEIGFGLVLDHDVETGEAIGKDLSYRYLPQKGPVVDDRNGSISGATLLALKNEVFESEVQHTQAKMLTRSLIDIQLSGKSLRTRRVIREMKQYEEQVKS